MPDSSPTSVDPVLAAAERRVGSVVREKWRLDRLLGVGGMAAVYAGTHRNGAKGAIKLLHVELALNAEVKSRFLREGYVANTVDHPGAVRVLDDDVTDDGAPFLVMELLEGETLDGRVVRGGGTLGVGEALGVVDQLLSVLEAAHAKGILHRDLKPENLFVTHDGKLKVLDFGIARMRALSEASNATRAGSVMGTPAFMAPEQARGLQDEVDARTDLWAAGATLFALIVGRAPHEGRTANEVLLAAMTQSPPPIASCVAGVGPHVAAFVDKSLRYAREERWPDALSMQAALRAAWADDQAGAPLPSNIALPSIARDADESRATGVPAAQPAAGSGTAVSFGRTAPGASPRRTTLVAGSAVVGVLALGVAAWLVRARDARPALAAPPVESSSASALVETATPSVPPTAEVATAVASASAAPVVVPVVAPIASATVAKPAAPPAPAASPKAGGAAAKPASASPPPKKPGDISFSSRQ